ncbi:hypothetical protein Z946_336 [Sulfitobacter noctilucicola]|nr:hypothetical protein Z946_336 [Sulfitobacter noctilucicola]
MYRGVKTPEWCKLAKNRRYQILVIRPASGTQEFACRILSEGWQRLRRAGGRQAVSGQ